jgi:multidrug efflux system outer membrane protein
MLLAYLRHKGTGRPEPGTALLRGLIVAGLLAGLAACAPMPPDTGHPDMIDASKAKMAEDIHLANEGWPDAQWWKTYNDPQLNGLIQQALQSSPSLQVAAERVNNAKAIVTARQSIQGVGFRLNADATRQRYSANGLFPEPIGGNTFAEYQLQAQASYAFDWWGKNRAYIKSAAGQVEAGRAELAQSEQVISALTAQTYFDLQDYWQQLAVLDQLEKTMQDIQQATLERVQHGLAPRSEWRAWTDRLAQLRQQRAAVKAQATSRREALRALVADTRGRVDQLKPVTLPNVVPHMPKQLGMELLARRPDLQAARWRIRSALSQVDYARAAFYPEINLLGAIGLDSLTFGNLFRSASTAWSIGPGLTLPLFSSKALSGQLAGARSERNALIADYNQQVLNAVRDVAQAGAALQARGEQLNQHQERIASVNESMQDTQKMFRNGLANRIDLLSARLDTQRLALEGLDLRNQALQADIALINTLGGGYHDTEAAKAELPDQQPLNQAISESK